jgi:hypothetical protein
VPFSSWDRPPFDSCATVTASPTQAGEVFLAAIFITLLWKVPSPSNVVTTGILSGTASLVLCFLWIRCMPFSFSRRRGLRSAFVELLGRSDCWEYSVPSSNNAYA